MFQRHLGTKFSICTKANGNIGIHFTRFCRFMQKKKHFDFNDLMTFPLASPSRQTSHFKPHCRCGPSNSEIICTLFVLPDESESQEVGCGYKPAIGRLFQSEFLSSSFRSFVCYCFTILQGHRHCILGLAPPKTIVICLKNSKKAGTWFSPYSRMIMDSARPQH